MGGWVLSSGLVWLVLVTAAVLATLLLATAVRRRQLAPEVADARRHGVGAGGAAVLGGVLAAAVVALGDVARPWGSGVSLALAPLAFGVVHTVVLWAGEASWPRPRGAVRAASLQPRRFPAEARRMRRVLVGAVLAVAAACTVGWATAEPDGRSLALPADPPPAGADWFPGNAAAGPYPGAVFAGPALVGTALLVLLVALAVRTVVARAAVPGDPEAERVLRAASAHRVLRGAATALLVLLGGFLVVGGQALRTASQGAWAGVAGDLQFVGHHPALVVLGSVLAALGGVLVLVALALQAVPAPRLRPAGPAEPPSPPPAPVPARLR